ncbi:hypothetical protein TNCV_3661521 [Trichonephila clavipes]|nr:hypothetical protein TNCV_3661521 [Trichonephila clavipes]
MTLDVLDCRHDLKNLTSIEKTIVFQWVPAHHEVPSNEKADFLVKKGFLIMQKTFRPMSLHSIKNLIERSINARAQEDLHNHVSHKSWRN